MTMDISDQTSRVLNLVNLARASYGAYQLDALLLGQPLSASFCPIGRSLRAGVEDGLFVAVGTRYLRVWALGKDTVAIGKEIMTAWELPQRRLKPSGEKSGFVLLPLPSELREFVDQFDRGLLPHFQGQIDPQDVLRLRELARGMPIPGRQPRSVWISGGGPGSHPSNLSTNLNP